MMHQYDPAFEARVERQEQVEDVLFCRGVIWGVILSAPIWFVLVWIACRFL